MENRARVDGFDMLRGLCAIGVAYYHLMHWFELRELYNLGLYGVYIFFILSGASLYIAYAHKLRSGLSVVTFLGLRYLRLLPLFGLIVLLVPLVNQQPYDYAFAKTALLNLSFAFGFANPGLNSPVTGGWSLGIECVFYLLFPVLVAFIAGPRRLWLSALVLSFLVQRIFVDNSFPATETLAGNWVNYTQVAAFCFYFVAGCALGRLLVAWRWRPSTPMGIVVSWLAFGLLAGLIASTSAKELASSLTGLRGAVLTLACVLLVAMSGILVIPRRAIWVALAMGNMSYGLYLLHPIIHTVMARYAPSLRDNPFAYTTGIVALSIGVALLLERYYERPLREAGRRALLTQPV